MADILTPEQQARDLLERIGFPNAQSLTSGDVVELANLIDRANPHVDDQLTRRYLHDPIFHAMVHAMVISFEGQGTARLTPQDVRDAVVVAEEIAVRREQSRMS